MDVTATKTMLKSNMATAHRPTQNNTEIIKTTLYLYWHYSEGVIEVSIATSECNISRSHKFQLIYLDYKKFNQYQCHGTFWIIYISLREVYS